MAVVVGVSVVAAWATGSSIMFENKKTPEETATETTPILNRRSDQRVSAAPSSSSIAIDCFSQPWKSPLFLKRSLRNLNHLLRLNIANPNRHSRFPNHQSFIILSTSSNVWRFYDFL